MRHLLDWKKELLDGNVDWLRGENRLSDKGFLTLMLYIVYIIIIYKSMTSDAISVFPVVRRQKIISGFLCWNFCLFVHVVVALDGQARFSPPVRVGFGPICVFA